MTLIPSKAILPSRVLIFRRGTEKSTHSSWVREDCGRDGGVGAIFLEPDFGKESALGWAVGEEGLCAVFSGRMSAPMNPAFRSASNLQGGPLTALPHQH